MTAWKEASFTEVFDIQGGTQPPKAQFKDKPLKGYVRLLQIRDFGEKPVPTYIPDAKTLKKCSAEDVLIGRYGASVGRICTGMEGAYNVALAKVINSNNIDPDFLRYWLESENFQAPLRLIQRTAQNGFNKEDLGKIVFKYPIQQDKQRKIAAWIKSSLNEVNIAVSALDASLEQLRTYKQSLLNSAIRGKLVPQDPKDEPASKLIERILEEKKSDILQIKDEIPWELPAGWSWAYLKDIMSITSGNVFKFTEVKNDSGVPYVKVGDMNDERNLNDVRFSKIYFKQTADVLKKTIPINSIIFPKRGGAIATNKKRYTRTRSILIDTNTMAITPSTLLNFDYIRIWFDSVNLASFGGASVIPQINNKDIEPMLVPVPPYLEQARIVQKVDSLIAFAKDCEGFVSKSLSGATILKQSILKKAFEGEL